MRPACGFGVGLAILLLSVGQACAQSMAAPEDEPESLFFTPSEMMALRKVLAPAADQGSAARETAASPVAAPMAAALPDIHISALVDFGDGQWLVWANGRRLTPASQPGAFKILAVTDDHVDLEISGDQPIRVRLRANQTWRAASGAIIEGSAR